MSEELIVPYNINNILITENDIKKLFAKYNLEINVKDINLYREALTHKSYVVSEYTNYNYNALKQIKDSMNPSVVDLMPKSSERIEYYGDTLVKCIVAKYLFERYYEEDEGFLTKNMQLILKKKTSSVMPLWTMNNYIGKN